MFYIQKGNALKQSIVEYIAQAYTNL